MAWVFICIAVGAALFVIWIIIDYLRVSSGLKPKAYLARQEIRECEMKIEAEQGATGSAKQAVEVLTEPPRVLRRLSYVSPATMAGVGCCW
jgi:cell division protein FtsL